MKVFELSFIIKAKSLKDAIKQLLEAMTSGGITNECIPLDKRIKEMKLLIDYNETRKHTKPKATANTTASIYDKAEKIMWKHALEHARKQLTINQQTNQS